MLFSSITFLYYFLPLTVLIYFLMPYRWKNLVLLAASLIFYLYGEPIYTLLMLGSVLSAYIHGLLIDRFRGTGAGRLFLISSVGISLLVLGFFKYADFFIGNFNSLTGAGIPLLKLALPIGISFYTFQTLSYTIDVYRQTAKVQKSFIRLATYVTLFPQLIAGPIVRYTTVEEELKTRRHTLKDGAEGCTRFVYGLAKKILIANVLGELCNIFRSSDEKTVGFYWLYAIAFSLHIYFDFSGYSDMAIGLGKLFGFHFLENFNYPYISRSISEFWRRWHISLGSWFRDYVYIPLGGNRVSRIKWFRNIAVVWFLTGFWHGADWNFILWGIYFAVFLVMEKLWLGKYLEKIPAALSRIYVWLAVVVSFVLFNADGIGQAVTDLKGMFGLLDIPVWGRETAYYLESYGVVLILAMVGATPLVHRLCDKLKKRPGTQRMLVILEPVALAVLLLVMTGYLVDGSFNPFLYFRF